MSNWEKIEKDQRDNSKIPDIHVMGVTERGGLKTPKFTQKYIKVKHLKSKDNKNVWKSWEKHHLICREKMIQITADFWTESVQAGASEGPKETWHLSIPEREEPLAQNPDYVVTALRNERCVRHSEEGELRKHTASWHALKE